MSGNLPNLYLHRWFCEEVLAQFHPDVDPASDEAYNLWLDWLDG